MPAFNSRKAYEDRDGVLKIGSAETHGDDLSVFGQSGLVIVPESGIFGKHRYIFRILLLEKRGRNVGVWKKSRQRGKLDGRLP